MSRFALLSAAASFVLLAAPGVHAAEFSGSAGPNFISNGIGGSCNQTSAAVFDQAVPGHVGPVTCGSFLGVGSASATASFGHLGASASAVTLTGISLPAVFGAHSEAADSVIFTSSDPTAITTTMSINMILDGILNASGVAGFSGADARIQGSLNVLGYGFFGFNYRAFSDGTFQSNNAMTQTGGVIGSNFNASFVTSTMVVPLNSPVFFLLDLQADAESGGADASATSDFDSSFRFPSGSDVFNLQDGVTVNSADGDWLANNRFHDPLAQASGAPEPTGWTLMIAGFGLAGAALRRRRPA